MDIFPVYSTPTTNKPKITNVRSFIYLSYYKCFQTLIFSPLDNFKKDFNANYALNNNY